MISTTIQNSIYFTFLPCYLTRLFNPAQSILHLNTTWVVYTVQLIWCWSLGVYDNQRNSAYSFIAYLSAPFKTPTADDTSGATKVYQQAASLPVTSPRRQEEKVSRLSSCCVGLNLELVNTLPLHLCRAFACTPRDNPVWVRLHVTSLGSAYLSSGVPGFHFLLPQLHVWLQTWVNSVDYIHTSELRSIKTTKTHNDKDS